METKKSADGGQPSAGDPDTSLAGSARQYTINRYTTQAPPTANARYSVCMSQTPDRRRQMLAAALWYAQRGWAVFPLHTPLFDAGGNCVGCTCEAYRTSEECKQNHPYLYLGPAGKCETPGKCPRVRWREKSTTDEAQIRKWWGNGRAWGGHIPNIGIDCGKSGLLVFDADSYKEGAGELSDFLTLAEQATVTALTGGGGQHLIFDAGGKEYGNEAGELPNGIDVRGAGGYIVAAPSIHKSGRAYAYEEGYGPRDVPLLPIPAALDAILSQAQQKATATAKATFTATTTERPTLTAWRLSQRIVETINQPAPVGKRSEADMSVCVALVYAGATDDEILAVFEHHPIGAEGKFAERGRAYLALTIGKARAHVAGNPRPDELIAGAKVYFLTNDVAPMVPDELKAKQRDAAGEIVAYQYRGRPWDRKLAPRILDIMADVGRVDAVTINAYQVVRTTNSQGQPVQIASHKTVAKVLARLRWFFDAEPIDGKPHTWRVSLSEAFQKVVVSTFPVSCTKGDLYPTTTNIDESGKVLISTFDHWKADDPYDRGTSRIVRDRTRREVLTAAAAARAAGEPLADAELTALYEQKLAALAPALGPDAILALHTLHQAGGSGLTVAELVEAHGMTNSAAGAILRKLRGLKLVESQRRYKEPSLHFVAPAAFDWIAEHQAEFRTYQAGVKRLDKALESAQRRADQVASNKDAQATHRNSATKRAGKCANKRFATLRVLHPDWSDKEIARFIYAQVPDRTDSKSTRQHAPEMPAPGVLGWNRLVELTGKERLTADEFGQLQALDRALGAGVNGRYGEVVYDRPARY